MFWKGLTMLIRCTLNTLIGSFNIKTLTLSLTALSSFKTYSRQIKGKREVWMIPGETPTKRSHIVTVS